DGRVGDERLPDTRAVLAPAVADAHAVRAEGDPHVLARHRRVGQTQVGPLAGPDDERRAIDRRNAPRVGPAPDLDPRRPDPPDVPPHIGGGLGFRVEVVAAGHFGRTQTPKMYEPVPSPS